MKIAAIALLLSSCGMASVPALGHRDVDVRRYEDVDGNPPDPSALGFTYEAGANHDRRIECLINEELLADADADKIVRVICHELENAIVLDVGEPDAVYGWYVYDSDTLPPFAPIPNDEGAWLADSGNHHEVIVRADWLALPTLDAVARLNDAAGVEIFQVK